MYTFVLLACLLLGTTFGGLASDSQYRNEEIKRELCSKVLCHAGQECVTRENQLDKAICQCKSVCPDHQKPVCGSDGITYPNHCELHRTACVKGKKIKIEKNGPCLEEVIPMHHPHGRVQKSKPVVCYEHNRDELRDRLMAWMKDMGKTLDIDLPVNKNIFKNFFEGVDIDKNGKLNRKEFMQLIKFNETVAKIPGEDEYINSILQGLCADALLAVTDEDSDWELSLHEFKLCLDPKFKPPHKLCELEGNMYNDGAEIPTDCNSCVCACGNWICTALNCDENDEASQNKVKNQFVLDGKEAKNLLEKEVTRHEVRLVKEGITKGKELVLMLLKPRLKSKN